jgi:probable F420-dependent oxidoreductase
MENLHMKFVLSTSFNPLQQLPAMALAADESGWEAMSFSDHVVHPETIQTPYPYTEDGSRRWEAFTDWPDPWVMIGGLATITTRLRFNTNVFVLPLRNPFLAAKAIATAAILSDYRVGVTIGMGWCREEFELMGQDFRNRGKRADEMVEIMRKLWRGGWVEHHGAHYAFERLEMSPALEQPVPIWVGGISDAALRRAARLGDGWLSDWQSSADIIGCIDKIRAFRAEMGKSMEGFSVMASPNDAFTPDAWRALAETGVTHLLTQPWDWRKAQTLDQAGKCDAIRVFGEKVIGRMR